MNGGAQRCPSQEVRRTPSLDFAGTNLAALKSRLERSINEPLDRLPESFTSLTTKSG